MIWILFLFISTYSVQGGVSVSSQEFHTQEACEYAAIQLASEFKTIITQRPKTICLPKGDTQ
jgi:hypothetical protein